jgi:hypothetical protein
VGQAARTASIAAAEAPNPPYFMRRPVAFKRPCDHKGVAEITGHRETSEGLLVTIGCQQVIDSHPALPLLGEKRNLDGRLESGLNIS